MFAILLVAALFVLYFAGQEVLRRGPVLCLWVLFAGLPILLTWFWFQVNDFDVFLWIKIYSVMFCVCWGTWLRFAPQGNNPKFLRTIALLLAANILEASVVDFLASGIAHNLNALSGALLIITLPYGARPARIDSHSRFRDLRLDLPFVWIVGYTLWNWSFVFLNYPELIVHHSAILVTALGVAAVDPQRWLQTRAATLGINLLLMATCYSKTTWIVESRGWFEGNLALVASAIAFTWLAIHGVVVGLEFGRRYARPRFTRTRDLGLFARVGHCRTLG